MKPLLLSFWIWESMVASVTQIQCQHLKVTKSYKRFFFEVNRSVFAT